MYIRNPLSILKTNQKYKFHVLQIMYLLWMLLNYNANYWVILNILSHVFDLRISSHQKYNDIKLFRDKYILLIILLWILEHIISKKKEGDMNDRWWWLQICARHKYFVHRLPNVFHFNFIFIHRYNERKIGDRKWYYEQP